MDRRGPVVPSQCEDLGKIVVCPVLISERFTISLSVMVVDEDRGVLLRKETGPAGANATTCDQPVDVPAVEGLFKFAGEGKLVDITVAGVFLRLDRFVGPDNFLDYVEPGTVIDPGENSLHVAGRNMFDGVNPEPVNSQGHQVVEVSGNSSLNVGGGGRVEVREVDQIALLNFPSVLVVGDVPSARVKVLPLVVSGIVVVLE